MLIILSGSETIHKKFFAKNIVSALNTFTVDGFTVDFTKNPFEVYDSSNNLVWKPNSTITGILNNEDGSLNHEMSKTLDKIIDLGESILSLNKNNHFSDIFASPLADYGLISGDELFQSNREDKGYMQTHTYQSILDMYSSRPFENIVISGIFSKTFIERIKVDLGAENVTVLNIIRNPAVCFLLNEKDNEYYTEKAPWSTFYDYVKLQYSTVTGTILKNMSGVITIKFEDIIRDGYFTLNNININIPDNHESYNGIITKWEKDNIIPLNNVTREQFDANNDFYLNFELLANFEKQDPIIDEFWFGDPEKKSTSTYTTEQLSPLMLTHLPLGIRVNASDSEKQTYADTFNAVHNTSYSPSELWLEFNYAGSATLKSALVFWNMCNNISLTAEQLDAVVPSNLFAAYGYDVLSYDDITS
jgi:hypothetical protein